MAKVSATTEDLIYLLKNKNKIQDLFKLEDKLNITIRNMKRIKGMAADFSDYDEWNQIYQNLLFPFIIQYF